MLKCLCLIIGEGRFYILCFFLMWLLSLLLAHALMLNRIIELHTLVLAWASVDYESAKNKT